MLFHSAFHPFPLFNVTGSPTFVPSAFCNCTVIDAGLNDSYPSSAHTFTNDLLVVSGIYSVGVFSSSLSLYVTPSNFPVAFASFTKSLFPKTSLLVNLYETITVISSFGCNVMSFLPSRFVFAFTSVPLVLIVIPSSTSLSGNCTSSTFTFLVSVIFTSDKSTFPLFLATISYFIVLSFSSLIVSKYSGSVISVPFVNTIESTSFCTSILGCFKVFVMLFPFIVVIYPSTAFSEIL